MVKEVTLVFPNVRALWDFAQTLKGTTMEINTSTNTLLCECNGTDIALAQEKYRAIVRQRVKF